MKQQAQYHFSEGDRVVIRDGDVRRISSIDFEATGKGVLVTLIPAGDGLLREFYRSADSINTALDLISRKSKRNG